jgi:hypothetical protein
MHYNFEKDLAASEPFVDAVAEILKKYNYHNIQKHDGKKYDIIASFTDTSMTKNHYTFEVKSDWKSAETGNAFIEFKQLLLDTGVTKSSGIVATQSAFWCHWVPGHDNYLNRVIILKPEMIMRLVIRQQYQVKTCNSDNVTQATGYLVPIEELAAAGKMHFYEGELLDKMRLNILTPGK